jgi:hypothetical protein
MIRMTDVTPSERLLTHVSQNQIPLGKLTPQRVERFIDVVGELQRRVT